MLLLLAACALPGRFEARIDADGDGFVSDEFSEGVDCDDGDAEVHPGAADPVDGRDQDCDRVLPLPGGSQGVFTDAGLAWTDGVLSSVAPGGEVESDDEPADLLAWCGVLGAAQLQGQAVRIGDQGVATLDFEIERLGCSDGLILAWGAPGQDAGLASIEPGVLGAYQTALSFRTVAAGGLGVLVVDTGGGLALHDPELRTAPLKYDLVLGEHQLAVADDFAAVLDEESGELLLCGPQACEGTDLQARSVFPAGARVGVGVGDELWFLDAAGEVVAVHPDWTDRAAVGGDFDGDDAVDVYLYEEGELWLGG